MVGSTAVTGAPLQRSRQTTKNDYSRECNQWPGRQCASVTLRKALSSVHRFSDISHVAGAKPGVSETSGVNRGL